MSTKVRRLDEVIIIFYNQESIFVFDKVRKQWIVFHRYLEVGGYNSWRRFRWNLMRIKKLAMVDCYRHAANRDIQHMVCASYATQLKLEEILRNEKES